MEHLESKRVSLSDIIDSDYSHPATLTEYAYKIGAGHYGEMTTVIDRVYDYISKHEMTSVNELSERLSLRPAQVERMIEMLETSQLIRLKYSVVPNGKVEVLIVNKEREKPNEIAHEERIKGLKKVVLRDVETLENAISSMEHHLNLWSSEAEEKMTNGGVSEQAATQISQEAVKIEKTLEHVRTDVSNRVGSIKKRLTEMRCKAKKENCKPETEKAGGRSIIGSGLFKIKNPFNF
ncbi:MAG: hypothetical protein V1909_01430 [Candidatus Micrarchaeota archaeon]